MRVEAAEAAVVQDLFATYRDEGVGLLGLAKALSRQGMPTPNGGTRWNSATVRGILTNPSYTGQVYAGRTRAHPPRLRRSATHPLGRPGTTQVPVPQDEWIPVATIPALVSAEEFDQVQAGSAGSASRSAAASPAEAWSKAESASAYDVALADPGVSGRSSGSLGRLATTHAQWAWVSVRVEMNSQIAPSAENWAAR